MSENLIYCMKYPSCNFCPRNKKCTEEIAKENKKKKGKKSTTKKQEYIKINYDMQ